MSMFSSFSNKIQFAKGGIIEPLPGDKRKYWKGTRSQYQGLRRIDPDTVYIIQ